MQRWSKEPRNCLHDVYCLTSISKFPTKAYQETHKNKKKIPKEQRTDPLPFYLWWCLEAEAQWKKEETGWNSTKKHKTP